MRYVVFLMTLFWSIAVQAAEPAKAETWQAEWSNRVSEQKGEWAFSWIVRDKEVSGTVVVDGKEFPVRGTRDGAWLELSWKDTEGRVTQVRGVVGGGEWRGAVLSGGGGRLVEYGRVRATPAR